MLTNKSLRSLGVLGAVAAFASLQACAPSEQSDDVKVKVSSQQGLTPKACNAADLAAGKCQMEDKSTGGRDARPRPPLGYEVKWTVCTNFVESDAKVANNSRIVTSEQGTAVVLTRADIQPGGADGRGNLIKVKFDSLPKSLVGGIGISRATGKEVKFLKIGQSLQVKKSDGTTETYIVSSPIGQPARSKSGRLEYKDTCFRNPKTSGKDTLGAVMEGYELSLTCVMEEPLADYNALSGEYPYWSPIYNWADQDVGMLNSPVSVHPHPDAAEVKGTLAGGIYLYAGYSTALNDINGTERDEFLNYYMGERFCHFMNNGGYEVPAAKRISTVSFPAPAADSKSLLAWRPVNRNVNIANKEVPPPAPEPPVEPEPSAEEAAAESIPESDTAPL